MNFLRRALGFTAAIMLAFGSAGVLPGAADEYAADDYDAGYSDTADAADEDTAITDEYYDNGEVSELPEDVPGEDVVPTGDEEDFAEDFAQMYDDPQYGKYLKEKSTYEEALAADKYALPGGGGELDSQIFSLGKYSNKNLTHNPRFDDCDKTFGIDVSYFQYDIDWEKVATDVDYAIIRVGYRGYGSAGDLVLDYKFKENLKEAKAAGIDVGVYFYTQAITSAEAREEADFVLKYLDGVYLELPVYFDIESVDYDSGRLDNAGLTVAQKTQICKAFCNRIIKNGYEAGVYANKYWLENLIDGEALGKSYPIWLAHYVNETDYAGNYNMWQFSSTGDIAGISTNVDMNVYYGELESGEETTLTLAKPTGFKYSVSNGIATFSCKEVSGANKYQLYSIDPDTSSYVKLGVSETPSISAELSDQYLGYVMRGVNTEGSTNVFGAFSSTIYAQKGMPANFKASEDDKGILTLTWDKLDEAEGYYLYRAAGANAEFTQSNYLSSSATSLRQAALKASTCYGFKLVPIVNGAKGVSTKALWYITSVDPVTGLAVSSKAADQVGLKWNAMTGAAKYEVAVYDASTGKYTTKATVTKNSTVVKGLSPKTKYSFAVRAIVEYKTAKRTGAYSSLVSVTTPLGKPASLYATAKSSGVKLTWKKVSGASKYRIYRKTGSNFVRIGETTAVSYTDKTAPSGRTVYTVKALYTVNGKLTLGPSASNCAVNAVPNQTAAYVVRSTASRIRVGWYRVSGCTGYKLYMYDTATGKYKTVKTIRNSKTTNAAVANLYSGTRYKFKVRAYKKGVHGITWSNFSKAIGVWTTY